MFIIIIIIIISSSSSSIMQQELRIRQGRREVDGLKSQLSSLQSARREREEEELRERKSSIEQSKVMGRALQAARSQMTGFLPQAEDRRWNRNPRPQPQKFK